MNTAQQAALDVDEAFVTRANIEHYRKMLAKETDKATRQTLVRLLSDEESRLKGLVHN